MSRSFSIRCIPPGIWALCIISLLASIWGSSKLYHREDVKPPIVKPGRFEVIFHAYNTQGKPLPKAFLEGTTPKIQDKQIEHMQIGDGLELTLNEGTELDVKFSYQGHRMMQHVVWQSGPAYEDWMQKGLLKKLKDLDANYNTNEWPKIIASLSGKTDKVKYHFPVAFYVPERH